MRVASKKKATRKKPAKKATPAGRPSRMELFEEKYVEDDSGCHNWINRLDKDGYGQFRDGARVRQAHIWGWEQKNGPLEVGFELDHVCRNRRCVNPDHLEKVTHAENMRRRSEAQDRLRDERGEESERSIQRKKKKELDAKLAAAARQLAPLKAAVRYAMLGETPAAARQAAEWTAHGMELSEEELDQLIILAQSPALEEARTGANAFDARMASYGIRLWLFHSIEVADLVQAGQVPFGVWQLQKVQQGFGGQLAQFKRVELDLAELLGSIAGADTLIDLKKLHAEVYARDG